MLKILFIHEVNYRSKVIFEMHEFPELLSIAGHEVHFLEFPEDTGLKNASVRTRSELISGRAYPEAKINLITPPTLGGGGIDRMLAPITVIPQLRKLIKKGGFDVVVLYAVPTSGWQTVRIAKKAGVPVIFRALDVSHLIRKGLTSQLVKLAERYVYRRATIISANNLILGDYVTNLGGRPDAPIVNYPPLDLDHFAHENRRQMRINMSIDQESFVATYMGSLFPFSGLLQVIADFALLSGSDDRLLIIGGGGIENELRKKVKELSFEHKVIFTGVISYAELPNYLSVSDVLINPFESTLVTNLALPHKVLQYLATGIPTVSTKLSGLFESLGDAAGIYWVDSPANIVEEILQVKQQGVEEKSAASELGRKFVNKFFNKQTTLTEIESTIRLVSRRKLASTHQSPSPDIAIVVPTLGLRTDYLRQSLTSLRETGAGLLCVVSPKEVNLDELKAENLFDLRIDDAGDGLANAINRGFASLPEHIKFISWLGDDDLVEKDSLFNAREVMMSKPNVVAVVGIIDYISPSGEKILTNRVGSLGVRILSWGPDLVPQPGSLFRRSTFNDIGCLNPEYRMAFDLDLFLKLRKMGEIEFMDQKVASFRWHPTSLSVSQRRSAVLEASRIRRRNRSRALEKLSLVWEPAIMLLTLLLGTVVSWRGTSELHHEDERILNAR
jgi:glycosyltransferase involved in cell wall biosynthesis/GT2 family glycosyltransferase